MTRLFGWWRTIAGAAAQAAYAAYLVPFRIFRGLLEIGGDYDFLSHHFGSHPVTQHPASDWIELLPIIISVGGWLLIWWDIRRHRETRTALVHLDTGEHGRISDNEIDIESNNETRGQLLDAKAGAITGNKITAMFRRR